MELVAWTAAGAVTPAQRRIAYAMSEAELMEDIRALITHYGLSVMHIHDSRRCWGPGYPDLEIWGRGRPPIWRECKTMHGTLSAEQHAWAKTIQESTGRWGLWRPVHWLSGQIDRELRDLAGVQGELFSP